MSERPGSIGHSMAVHRPGPPPSGSSWRQAISGTWVRVGVPERLPVLTLTAQFRPVELCPLSRRGQIGLPATTRAWRLRVPPPSRTGIAPLGPRSELQIRSYTKFMTGRHL